MEQMRTNGIEDLSFMMQDIKKRTKMRINETNTRK